jgi:hypothetical protein
MRLCIAHLVFVFVHSILLLWFSISRNRRCEAFDNNRCGLSYPANALRMYVPQLELNRFEGHYPALWLGESEVGSNTQCASKPSL